MDNIRPLKVKEVNNYIKKLFATDIILSNIEVEGEISNYNHHYSGHRYFSLKDESGRIKCVMFKSYGQKLDFDLEEGQKIVAKGYISIYEKTGEYQLYVTNIKDQGVGVLYQKYEELKNKLEKEGLFDSKHKKEIPFLPKKIGIITSATGAAIEDMINVIGRRFPACNILVYPSLVQGSSAPERLINGLKYLDIREDIDLIIIGRGGGSIDELFAFNDEKLARTIFEIDTPIISAVGHETDFTISDFVSDLRAPTPSAAAELAVPNLLDVKIDLDNKYRHLITKYKQIIEKNKSSIENILKSLEINSPQFKIRNQKQNLDFLLRDILDLINTRVREKKDKLNETDKKLQLLNPSLALTKGAGILINKDGKVIKSVEDINLNDDLEIILKDGRLDTVIKEIYRGDEIGG